MYNGFVKESKAKGNQKTNDYNKQSTTQPKSLLFPIVEDSPPYRWPAQL